MAGCFCGCDRPVGKFGHRARANRLGRKLAKAVPMAQAALVRLPQLAGDEELQRLAADGPRRLAEVQAYVHEERSRELLDADGINDWYAAWVQHYGEILKDGTEGWVGMNPLKVAELLLLGERGTATIQEVRDTGMTVNEDPRVELRLWVTPERGDPFETTRKVMVSRIAVPLRGTKLPVLFDPQERDRITFRRDDLHVNTQQGPIALG